jgi:hypothetical protein
VQTLRLHLRLGVVNAHGLGRMNCRDADRTGQQVNRAGSLVVGTDGSTEKLTMQGGSPQVDWHITVRRIWHEVASMVQMESEGLRGLDARCHRVMYGPGLGWSNFGPCCFRSSARLRTGR